jgi:AcrR family transcriptional regulator
MKEQKDDRRSRRTRDLLRQALFGLMQKKRYGSITVQDIIDAADVGRSTFYSHFIDKEDLMISSMEVMLETFTQGMPQNVSSPQSLLRTAGLFKHVQEQQTVLLPLLQGRGLQLFYEKGQIYLSKRLEKDIQALVPKGQKTGVPVPVIANYVAGTFITLMRWWLDNKLPYSPERMDEIFQQLVMPGVWNGLGKKG